MESRRQKRVAKLIQEALGEVFQKHGANFYGSAFVTITDVALSPDLMVAKIYLSIYNVKDKEDQLDIISSHSSEIRRYLGQKIRNQLRRIPELIFYLDNTLDEALRVNELLKQIKKDDPNSTSN